MTFKKVEAEIDGRRITIESGRLAKQANGSVLVTCDDTVVLVTATAARDPKEISFLPLTVEYQERLYSVGKIPGSFFRREIGRPSEKEVLTCRLIDRPLRPLFPKGFNHETQIIGTVLSCDQQFEPDTLAMLGASAALMVSNIPYDTPIAGMRVGHSDGRFCFNPTKDQLENSSLDFVVAGTRSAVVMVEGSARLQQEEMVLDAIFAAHKEMQALIDLQEELREAIGKPKWTFTPPEEDVALREKIESLAAEEMRRVITTVDKMERYEAYDTLKDRMCETLAEETDDKGAIGDALSGLKKKMMRERIVVEKTRIDGRAFDQVRPIDCQVGYLPRTHGSALFTRGETQAMVTATLGGERDKQRIDSLYGNTFNNFMLHYNFPPFCVGEVRFMRGPSRRDIGHGVLAKRGISAVLPDLETFPYTLRVVSDVLESNGSSSMATACGASLSLMDAGVPIKDHVSGIAMGLIKEGDEIVILTDILGDEDHLGDMDFKVVGTRDGVSALQMDIKIEGVTREIMGQALTQAKEGRLHIIGIMEKAIQGPRGQVSQFAPKYKEITISPAKIRDLIGPSGKIIKGLSQDYHANIEVTDDGLVRIFSPNEENETELVKKILGLTAVPEAGKVYEGLVKGIKEFGAFVEIMPGTEGLLHISEMDTKRVNQVSDIVKEGDTVRVKVLAVEANGRIRLSRKALLLEEKG